VSQKIRSIFIFLKNHAKHWPILISFGKQHRKKLDVNDRSFVHLILILSLHYLVKCS